jgi:hypothetical protein
MNRSVQTSDTTSNYLVRTGGCLGDNLPNWRVAICPQAAPLCNLQRRNRTYEI